VKGNADVIAVLGDVLCAELTAINQYFIHARMRENWRYKRLAEYTLKESIGEMKHAQVVIDRILYFDGQPNMQGQWNQASDIITYSIEDPEADRAEHIAISGQRAMVGRPIIDPIDGKIPYQPWAAKYREFLYEQHRKPSKPQFLDPVSRGFQEGVPRISYQGTFQIKQFPGSVLLTYDYHHSYRVIPLDGRPHAGKDIKLWMGDSRGHWEGKTLVVDVSNLNDQTWFTIIGDFHSDALHVTERWTPTAPDHIVYVATIEDRNVYTQPWKLRVDYRRQPVDEQWESAVWEGNRTADVVLGDAKK